MTDDARRASYRTFNEWISQLHWDVRFCRAVHATEDVACQSPLGHATLGGRTERLHVGFGYDPATSRARRVTWSAAQSRPLPVSAARIRRLLDEHPANGPRRDENT